jgi:hypothetical protein
MVTTARFQCIQISPARWTVWDTIADQPASLGGSPLTARTKPSAEAACDVLNRIYKNHLERRPLRPHTPGA